MGTEYDLSKLRKVRKQIEKLEANKKNLKAQEFARVLAEVKKMINFFGFTAYELGVDLRRRPVRNTVIPPKAKYQKDGLTWGGKGRHPYFIKRHLEQGGTLHELRIKKQP